MSAVGMPIGGTAPHARAAYVEPRRTRLDRAAIRARHWLLSGPSIDRFLRLAARSLDTGDEIECLDQDTFERRTKACRERVRAEGLGDAVLLEALALIRVAAGRTIGLRHYPEQLAAGAALAVGLSVEMATGEGKTLASTIPATLGAWLGKPCHVLTTNEYLVQRDCALNRDLYRAMGVTVASVLGADDVQQRRCAYRSDIVYLTAKQACADHLIDRLFAGTTRSGVGRLAHAMVRTSEAAPMQRGLGWAIVDEADSLLIDDASTPLVISAPKESTPRGDDDFSRAASIAARMEPRRDYRLREAHQEVELTATGQRAAAEASVGWGGVWNAPSRRAELVTTALRVRHFYERDRSYLVRDGRVIIIDPSTGRMMPDRTWRHGLHQAVEAAEGLEHSTPTETRASLSFQRFFRRYERVCGMSGTLHEVASELGVVYGVRTVTVPTHRPMVRTRASDLLFARSTDRWRYVVSAVRRCIAAGRPVLIGTSSVSSSEHLSVLLSDEGIGHALLNAHRDAEEAQIISLAGRAGAVTLATNMAGRGTDIRLDDPARDAGGLHVIIAEVNTSARLDRQLLGRAGRQGDPGSGRVVGCVEDELFQRYAPAALLRLTPGTSDGRVPKTAARWLVRASRRRVHRLEVERRILLSESDDRHDDAMAFAGVVH